MAVSSSVLQFDYAGRRMNLLDTPGHNDRCCGGHFNLGAHAGDLEREVDRDCRAGVDRYPSAACIRKPYSLGREIVSAYRHQAKPVEAGLCGSGGLLEARRHVDDLNDGARDAGA